MRVTVLSIISSIVALGLFGAISSEAVDRADDIKLNVGQRAPSSSGQSLPQTDILLERDLGVLKCVLDHNIPKKPGARYLRVLRQKIADWSKSQRSLEDRLKELRLLNKDIASLLSKMCQRKLGDGLWPTELNSEKLRLFTEEEQKKIDSKHFWDEFYKAIPAASGIASMSLPGYNESGTKTLIFYSSASDGLSGGDDLYVCVFTEGQWKVKRTISLWIS